TSGRTDVSGDKILGLGLRDGQVARIKEFLSIPQGRRREVLARLEALFKNVDSAKGAIETLGFICDSLEALGLSEENVALDLSIARGLEYYTGPVFEAVLTNAPEFGSVFGGGRYDGLVERFLGKKVPAVGASIGVDRLYAALEALSLVDAVSSTAHVLVTTMDEAKTIEYQKFTRELRAAGINTELYLGQEKNLGKQLQYADRLGIPVAVIIGSDEFARGEVTVKNLRLGALLQDKKNSSSGKEREEWLRLSRTVKPPCPKTASLNTSARSSQNDNPLSAANP
ncbi:MAG TPA: ATP phosphoribosyltransferase regulatory subunit, partial [Bacteroidota bacterium]|nr:ATP phosphoribosyltransferase regulatory subunit [Bacteroidota bacterium]